MRCLRFVPRAKGTSLQTGCTFAGSMADINTPEFRPEADHSGVGFAAPAEVVVVDLDAEHDGRRYCRDGVGDDQRPVDGVAAVSYTHLTLPTKA